MHKQKNIPFFPSGRKELKNQPNKDGRAALLV